jgi:hypothetical protein
VSSLVNILFNDNIVLVSPGKYKIVIGTQSPPKMGVFMYFYDAYNVVIGNKCGRLFVRQKALGL